MQQDNDIAVGSLWRSRTNSAVMVVVVGSVQDHVSVGLAGDNGRKNNCIVQDRGTFLARFEEVVPVHAES